MSQKQMLGKCLAVKWCTLMVLNIETSRHIQTRKPSITSSLTEFTTASSKVVSVIQPLINFHKSVSPLGFKLAFFFFFFPVNRWGKIVNLPYSSESFSNKSLSGYNEHATHTVSPVLILKSCFFGRPDNDAEVKQTTRWTLKLKAVPHSSRFISREAQQRDWCQWNLWNMCLAALSVKPTLCLIQTQTDTLGQWCEANARLLTG